MAIHSSPEGRGTRGTRPVQKNGKHRHYSKKLARRRQLGLLLMLAVAVGGVVLGVRALGKGAPAAGTDAGSGASSLSAASAGVAQSTATPAADSAALAEAQAAAAEAQAILDDPLMILVSVQSPMPDGYTVNAVKADEETQKQLSDTAAAAFQEMQAAAKAAGVSLRLQSGYRSVDYQQGLFERQVQKWKDTGMDEAAATEKAKTVVNLPGCSEHNCGLAADINCNEYYALDEGFENTATFTWLCENAEAYGFILRYPKADEDITGIIYEPWHWRYVGVENAKRINATGLCLESYRAQLMETVAAA